MQMLGAIDSLLIAGAMATLGAPLVWRRRMVPGFVVFDFIAAWLGHPVLVLFPGAAVLISVALSGPVLWVARTRPRLYLLLPVLCSIDNLLIGPGDGPSQLASAAADGVTSGMMAWLGLALGDAVAKRLTWGSK